MFRYVSVMFIRGEMHWTKRFRELSGLKCSFLTESKRNLLRQNRSISIFLKGSPFLGKNSRYKLARNSANELGFPIRFYPKKNNIIIKELYEKKKCENNTYFAKAWYFFIGISAPSFLCHSLGNRANWLAGGLLFSFPLCRQYWRRHSFQWLSRR